MVNEDFAVVIPSIRDVKNVDSLDCKVIVVDDSNGNINPSSKNMEVYDYRRQKQFFKDLFGASWRKYYEIIPHKTDTCRSFGFLVALQEGFPKIITMDDDVIPPEDFLEKHDIVGKTVETRPLLSWGWYNPIDMLKLKPDICAYVRGYPQWERDEKEFLYDSPEKRRLTVLNCGLWTNIPDIDAMDKITETPISTGFREKTLKRVSLETGTFAPLSIMNVSFLKEVIPAFYQVPMKYNFGNGETIDRFGDVLSSFIFEHLAHKRGELVTIGEPLVEHIKQGNILQELKNENWGHVISPLFYNLVGKSMEKVEKNDYMTMYEQFTNNFLDEIKKAKINVDCIHNYLKFIVNNMRRWNKVCQKIL